MRIELNTDEEVKLVVDDNCAWSVWGERNNEGTMILKYEKCDTSQEDSE